MTIMTDVLNEANNVRDFEAKETPIVMSDNGHVAQTGEVEIVNEIQRDVRTNGKTLDRALVTFPFSK